jgi:hypothetical protein
MKRIALIAAACAFFGINNADAAVLLTNGGFDTGNFTGWSLSTTTRNTVETTQGEFTAQAGSAYAQLSFPQGGSNNNDATLSQTFVTTAGQSLVLSFYLQGDGGTPSDFKVAFDNTLLQSLSPVPDTNGWVLYSFNVTSAASNTLTFSFNDQGSGNSSNIGLDSVSIAAAVPEPSTWAMMILGFFGVGFMAYRRKQHGPDFRLA